MKKRTLSAFIEEQKKDQGFKEVFEHYRSSFEIGLQIKALRKNVGWTQVKLAKALNVSQQVISRLEKGEMTNPTIETLERIAHVTGRRLKVNFETV
jgi:DNA-binding XRE family transcriptional regulator